jgi:uncharacterized protein involved in type VI secretion and phage assembly
MAKKVLKNRTQITSTLRNELNNELKILSEETDIPISKLLDQAVELLIENKRGVQRDTQRHLAPQGLERDTNKYHIDINLPVND